MKYRMSLIMCVLTLLCGCGNINKESEISYNRTTTEEDVIPKDNIDAQYRNEPVFLGVCWGDSTDRIIERFGEPDEIEEVNNERCIFYYSHIDILELDHEYNMRLDFFENRVHYGCFTVDEYKYEEPGAQAFEKDILKICDNASIAGNKSKSASDGISYDVGRYINSKYSDISFDISSNVNSNEELTIATLSVKPNQNLEEQIVDITPLIDARHSYYSIVRSSAEQHISVDANRITGKADIIPIVVMEGNSRNKYYEEDKVSAIDFRYSISPDVVFYKTVFDDKNKMQNVQIEQRELNNLINSINEGDNKRLWIKDGGYYQITEIYYIDSEPIENEKYDIGQMYVESIAKGVLFSEIASDIFEFDSTRYNYLESQFKNYYPDIGLLIEQGKYESIYYYDSYDDIIFFGVKNNDNIVDAEKKLAKEGFKKCGEGIYKKEGPYKDSQFILCFDCGKDDNTIYKIELFFDNYGTINELCDIGEIYIESIEDMDNTFQNKLPEYINIAADEEESSIKYGFVGKDKCFSLDSRGILKSENNYTPMPICGVYVGMSIDDAKIELQSRGFQEVEKGIYRKNEPYKGAKFIVSLDNGYVHQDRAKICGISLFLDNSDEIFKHGDIGIKYMEAFEKNEFFPNLISKEIEIQHEESESTFSGEIIYGLIDGKKCFAFNPDHMGKIICDNECFPIPICDIYIGMKRTDAIETLKKRGFKQTVKGEYDTNWGEKYEMIFDEQRIGHYVIYIGFSSEDKVSNLIFEGNYEDGD